MLNGAGDVSLGSRAPKWGRVEYLGFLVVVLVIGGTFVYHRVTQPDGVQVVMQFERDGPRVNEDASLMDAMSGVLAVEDDQARSAYCVNGWYWETDVTLNTLVLVSSSERLVRAAELAASARFAPGLVEAVERALFDLPDRDVTSVGELPRSVRERFTVEELEEYLVAAVEEPSQRAQERFVVYAVSTTIWDQFVMFIDLDNVDRAAIGRFDSLWGIGDDEILVAGRPDVGSMSNTRCAELFE